MSRVFGQNGDGLHVFRVSQRDFDAVMLRSTAACGSVFVIDPTGCCWHHGSDDSSYIIAACLLACWLRLVRRMTKLVQFGLEGQNENDPNDPTRMRDSQKYAGVDESMLVRYGSWSFARLTQSAHRANRVGTLIPKKYMPQIVPMSGQL
jgi:hypothetical protein